MVEQSLGGQATTNMKSDFDMNKLTEVSLDISKIHCTCKIWENKRFHRRGGLISFSGHYPPGSSGGKDATFIKWKLVEFVSLGYPYHLDGLRGEMIFPTFPCAAGTIFQSLQ